MELSSAVKSFLNIVVIVGIAIISYQLGYSNIKRADPPSKITLHYFDARWTTETIRLLLKYGGIEFEDNRVKGADWSDIKLTMPYGHLPVIEVDGEKGAQSIAIARYIAKMVKLTGESDWEDLLIDATVDTLSDVKEKIAVIFAEKDEDAKEKLRQTHLKETIPYYFEKFEAQAKANEGYLVGKKLTWADFYFTVVYDVYTNLLRIDIIKDYPNLGIVRQRVLNFPAVKSWIEKRPKSDF